MNPVSRVVGTILFVLLCTACDQVADLTSGGGGEDEAADAAAGAVSASASTNASASERETEPSSPTGNSQPANSESERDAEPLVVLDPDDASTEGSAQYQCKDPYGCWWLVHCGHAICDGAWNWKFPSEGTYRLNWRGVQQKCAGSPPFQIRINDNVVTSGEIPQYGSCAECTPENAPNIFVDQGLGTFDIDEGDKVTLWIETEFSCGIDGPGAYGAFDDIVAERVD